MEKNDDWGNLRELLQSTVLLQESYQHAKKRYSKKIAPDFRLFRFFNINENTLSKCFAFLLKPDETHGQGELFLNGFYQLIERSKAITTKKQTEVYTEYTISGSRRIDILIDGENELTAIENKPWAVDQKDQLQDYAQWLAVESHRRGIGWSLIYLCNNDINEFSLRSDLAEEIKRNVKPVTFIQVERWLSHCALYIEAPAVRCFVDALIKFIREDINGDIAMELQNELTEKLVASPQNLRAALSIAQNIRQVKERLWRDFIIHLRQQLLPIGTQVVTNDELSLGGKYASFSLLFKEGDDFKLCWEFSTSDYRNLAYGICSVNEPDEKIHLECFPAIASAMSDVFPEIDATIGTTEWWPWWCHADVGMDVPRNWNMDAEAWSLLLERGEGSFAQTIVSMAKRIHNEVDLSLFRATN